MSDVPKIVHDRLRTGAPGGTHPDADMLTAFAEQALSPGEREDVVRHLARCGDCREIVALSIPPMEAVAQPEAAATASVGKPADRSRAWFAWPNLRWAAMAAAGLVVASILWLRPGQQHKSMVERVNQQAESTAPAAYSNNKPAPPPADQRAPALVAKTVKPDSRLLRAGPERRFDVLTAAPAPAKTPAVATPTRVDDGKRLSSMPANAGIAAGAMTARDQVEVTASRGLVATEAAPAGKAASSQEVMVVTGEANAVQATTGEDKLMARVEPTPPVVKAKQAAEEAQQKTQGQDSSAQKKFSNAYSVSDRALDLKKTRSKQSKDVAAQWSLAEGRLQRSMDAGATWQIVLQLQHPLLSFGARGSDVWAGGQAGTLFHSADSGATWTMVQPATKNEALAADIVAIEIRGPAEIVLSTSNRESWTTSDGGKTWEKK